MDEETLTVWLDTALLMLGGFILMTVLMLSVVNPPAKAAQTAGEQSPGNVIIEAKWDDRDDADVDLWVEAPGDKPVGYSSKSGQVFNLLRDDLGHSGDPHSMNYEVVYGRGMPAGEYIANVHLYRFVRGPLPVSVRVVASIKPKPGEDAREVAVATVQLQHENQEDTAFRFTLDGKGRLVAGSINNVFRELRVAAQ